MVDMKMRLIKYIMFNYVIAILEFINVFYLWDLSLEYLYRTYGDIKSENDISAYIRYPILFLLLIFIAYMGKFIVFKKKARKENLISVAMILISVLWLVFMKVLSYAVLICSMLNWEMHDDDDINIRFMIVSCIICVIYIIFGERIHKKISRKRV